MFRAWEEEAEAQLKRDQVQAKSEGRATFVVILSIGIVLALIFGAYDAVQWYFFNHPPRKDDLQFLLFLAVVMPVCAWFIEPFATAHSIRVKRAIRIEAKLDYLIGKQEEMATQVGDIENRLR